MSKVLERDFFLQTDVVRIARDLIGKVLVTGRGRTLTSGIITETEAYAGATDRASHAYAGRRTARNENMYAPGGIAYVYKCYGIHDLFNVVTNHRDVPHAVLVRALQPLHGEALMRSRRGPKAKGMSFGELSGGPGKLTTALGITLQHNGMDLLSGTVRLEDHGIVVPTSDILVGPRIGVDYAGDDALLPYRFRVHPEHSFAPR
ncbi:MAG: DNA-3-methyladenine glycosylase [Flavobacteriales bacterium]|nr:MAG: DNA-3-methyladenine glycosylase [Flavobacteriales bacterium]